MIEINGSNLICNGQEVKLRFGLKVLQEFHEKHGFTLDEVTQNMAGCLNKNLLNAVDLIFDALVYSHNREKKECTVTWDDVEAWMSDNPSIRTAIIAVFEAQSPPPVDDKKKEVTGSDQQ